jgi:hypothetical protein
MDRTLHFGEAAGSVVEEGMRFLSPVEATVGKRKNKKNRKTMNRKIKSYNAEYLINNDVSKVKTLDMRLAVTDRDLGEEIRRVFELAKSSGQELNLTFSCEVS